eukprot:SAG31_NODE_12806_length_915_cov_1.049020_1_plen_116_part_00
MIRFGLCALDEFVSFSSSLASAGCSKMIMSDMAFDYSSGSVVRIQSPLCSRFLPDQNAPTDHPPKQQEAAQAMSDEGLQARGLGGQALQPRGAGTAPVRCARDQQLRKRCCVVPN